MSRLPNITGSLAIFSGLQTREKSNIYKLDEL